MIGSTKKQLTPHALVPSVHIGLAATLVQNVGSIVGKKKRHSPLMSHSQSRFLIGKLGECLGPTGHQGASKPSPKAACSASSTEKFKCPFFTLHYMLKKKTLA